MTDLKPDFTVREFGHALWHVPPRYKELDIIGCGAYGSVCAAFDTRLQRKVAIKKLTKPLDNTEYAKRAHRELKILAHVSHENVLCLIDAFTPQCSMETLKDVYLVTPLMDADLAAVIHSQKLSDDHIRFFVYQILRALKYMHSAGLIHRDLKPGNIGVNLDCELKLLDFGLARQKQSEMSGYVATRWYRAPEIIFQWMHYNESVDIWSVACIMAEMRLQRPLFDGSNHVDQVKKILRLLGKPDEESMQKMTSDKVHAFLNTIMDTEPQDFYTVFSEFPADAIDLLQRMLHLDPDRRLTATQALAHRYFQAYHNEADEPTGEPFMDALEDRNDVTLEEWRKHIWGLLENFVPKLDSLTWGGGESTTAAGDTA